MTKRILVVDDEKPVRETLAALLRHEGYNVVAAECGQDLVRDHLAHLCRRRELYRYANQGSSRPGVRGHHHG